MRVDKKREIARLRKRLAELKVTEKENKKKLKTTLQEMREMYRVLVFTSPEAVTMTDLSGKITDASPRTLKLHGYKRLKELIGASAFKLIAPEDHVRALRNLKKTQRGVAVTNLEYTLLKKDGSRFAGELSASLIRDARGKPKAFIAVTRDISKDKKVEQSLRKSQEEFELAFQNAPDAIFLADAETGLITNCNRAAEMLLEKKRTAIVGCSQMTLHPPEKREYYVSMFKSHIEQEGAVDDEAEVVTRTGKIKPVHITASLTIIDGKPILQGIFRDISGRKIIEKALVESEEKYRTLTDNINVGVYRNTPGPKGRFIEANPAIVRMFGYKNRKEFLATKVANLYLKPGDRKKFNEKILRSGFVKNEEVLLKTKNGVPFIGSVSAVAVSDDQNRICYYDGIVEDITERKRAEEELRRFATLDSLTGVLNRGSGLLFFNKNLKLSNQSNLKMSICYIDVDNLKTINDAFGHKEGDETLKLVSRFFKESVREGDTVCRLGGDEFLLIFPQCPIRQACAVWDRIEKKLSAFNARKSKRYIIALSQGIIEYDPRKALSIDKLLALADQEMYKTKHAKLNKLAP